MIELDCVREIASLWRAYHSTDLPVMAIIIQSVSKL